MARVDKPRPLTPEEFIAQCDHLIMMNTNLREELINSIPNRLDNEAVADLKYRVKLCNWWIARWKKAKQECLDHNTVPNTAAVKGWAAEASEGL